jgi:prephenate dehydrogenase
MHVNITIIGLDRLSASFGLALKRYQAKPKTEHQFTIVGSDAKPNALKAAEKIGAIDSGNRALDKALEKANLVLLNVPFGQLESVYANLGPELAPGTVVLDLALLKQPSIEWARQHFPTNSQGTPLAYLVGITPIVNFSGLYSGEFEVEAARPDLFDNAEFLITPDPKCPGEAISLAEDIIRLVGGKPRFMDPAEHDGLIAATEGLPALLGVGVFHTLQKSEGWMELRRMVNPSLALVFHNLRSQSANDSFAFFTRNRDNLARQLEALIGTLNDLRDALADPAAGDDRLEALLARVQTEWEKWDLKRTTGGWDSTPLPESPGAMGSLMGGLLGGMGRRRPDQPGDDE